MSTTFSVFFVIVYTGTYLCECQLVNQIVINLCFAQILSFVHRYMLLVDRIHIFHSHQVRTKLDVRTHKNKSTTYVRIFSKNCISFIRVYVRIFDWTYLKIISTYFFTYVHIRNTYCHYL